MNLLLLLLLCLLLLLSSVFRRRQHGVFQMPPGRPGLFPSQRSKGHGIIGNGRVQGFVHVSHRLAVADQEDFGG